MNETVLFAVLGIEVALLMIGVLLWVWDWQAWLRKKYEPTHLNAVVHIEPKPAVDENGNFLPYEKNEIIIPKKYEAKFLRCIDGDSFYSYQVGREKYEVGVPAGYGMRFDNGKRQLRLYDGDYMAVPWDSRTWNNIPAPMAHLVSDKNLAFKMVDSITGGGFDWSKYIIPLAIIGLLALASYFTWDHFKPVPITQNVTQNQTIQVVR